jgi:hypothetical protein
MNEKTYPFPAQLAVAIVNYLQQQPWGEVNELMYRIQCVCRPIDEAEARAGGDAQLPPLPPGPNGSGRRREIDPPK